MADTIKCPSCGSNLTLNADTQLLECPNCGQSFNPSTLDVTVEELEPKAPEAASESGAEPAHEAAEAVSEPVNEEAPEQTEFVCNSCGAKVVTDVHTAATFCAFCGSPALVGKRLTERFQPSYMIPFKFSRDAAEAAFVKWAGKGRWTPFGFVSKKNIAKLTGLYVPFWLFDIEADIHAAGTAKKVTCVGDKRITDTYSFERTGKAVWNFVPLDGETRISDELMEAIEPYDFRGLIPYDYRYLPGFYADRYDQSPEDLATRATERGVKGMSQLIRKSLMGKYDEHTIKENRSKLEKMEANYALLPVWFLSYQYHNKNYYFAMNGQTGEVAGELPVSPVKRVMLFFVLLGIFAVVARILLGIFMRGIWG